MTDWYIYLVRTSAGSLYIGVATDVARRLTEHQSGSKRGAKYLRRKGRLSLVYQAKLGSRGLALKAEHAFKKLPKSRKEELVQERLGGSALLRRLGIPTRGNLGCEVDGDHE